MNETFLNNNFYSNLFKSFDTKLMEQCQKTKLKLSRSLDTVEVKLKSCETSIREHVIQKSIEIEREIKIAEVIVNREMKGKIIMSNWTSHFLGSLNENDTLDPLTYAFTRFSLSVCLCYKDVTASYMIDSQIHCQLVAYAAHNSELVQGPALMALVHISIHDELKPAIVLAGVLPLLCRILATSNSKSSLCQACKLCGSLALYFPNKSLIVNSGCLHGLLDLILGTQRETDDYIQSEALGALANINLGNDACRTLTVDLNGLKPIISAIQTSQSDQAILRGIKALGNIAYCSSYCSGSILKAGGHLVVLEILQAGDILRQPLLTQAALIALSNMCNNENTQAHVGATQGLCEAAVRICEFAREAYVVAEAATLLLALMWGNSVNKARVASKGACTVLVKRLIRHASDTADNINLYCVERLSFALASMLLHNPTHELMHDIGGYAEAVDICKRSSSDVLLRAVSQVLVAMLPCPQYLVRCHDDLYILPVEKVGVIPVLKKIRLIGFGSHPIVPIWIEKGLLYLPMTDESLRNQPKWIKTEFTERVTSSKELAVLTLPDVETNHNMDLRGLLFSTF